MEATNSSPTRNVFSIILFAFGLIGIYYLYQYLFGPKSGTSFTLIGKMISSNVDKPITITSDNLPGLFEGGEFSISSWFYITNWSYRAGLPKSIINIGGPNFDTLRIYLGGYKPKLNIRLHTLEGNDMNQESLNMTSQASLFTTLQTDSGLIDSTQLCDLPEVELQRWVNVTVAVNGRTVDVYLNGKLSRSCVLPKIFKVDAGGYSAKLLTYGGFGGKIAQTFMYDAALNPEQVYTNYMRGPEPITNIGDWFASFFAPTVN
jgi:hypothetical protein